MRGGVGAGADAEEVCGSRAALGASGVRATTSSGVTPPARVIAGWAETSSAGVAAAAGAAGAGADGAMGVRAVAADGTTGVRAAAARDGATDARMAGDSGSDGREASPDGCGWASRGGADGRGATAGVAAEVEATILPPEAAISALR
jgi:hypothetical protein